MIPAAHQAARWRRPGPRRTWSAPLAQRMVQTAFPGCRLLDMEWLGDGLRNANFKVQIDARPEHMVLRIYEHDPSLCRKEIDLMCLVAGSVPVPEVLYAEPHADEEIPPFALLHYVQGVTLRELKRGGDAQAIAQAAYSAGRTLASIGRFTFAKSGWLAPGPTLAEPLLEGADPLPRFVDSCLESENLQRLLGRVLQNRTRALVWSWAPHLARLGDDQPCLVHCDFGNRNLVVRSIAGEWSVAAVLDWEFAVSDSPLIDLGHFLRYERAERHLLEPHFSRGFVEAGGKLPQDWRQLARLFDLSALCEALTRDQLPDDVTAELVELVSATVENRDPRLGDKRPY